MFSASPAQNSLQSSGMSVRKKPASPYVCSLLFFCHLATEKASRDIFYVFRCFFWTPPKQRMRDATNGSRQGAKLNSPRAHVCRGFFSNAKHNAHDVCFEIREYISDVLSWGDFFCQTHVSPIPNVFGSPPWRIRV